MKKIAIYTSISENYDSLKKIKVSKKSLDKIDFYYFKENKEIEENNWNHIPYPSYLDSYNSVEKNRYVKMHPHLFFENYELSLYIDGNIQPIGDILSLIENNKDNLITMFKHPARDCIYDEAIACINLKKEKKDIVEKHMNLLKSKNYPEKNGLNEANVILRKHNQKKMTKAMEEWWQEFLSNSKRDQLSLNFVLWKNDIEVSLFKGNLRNSNFFIKYEHGNFKKYEIKRYYEKKISKFLKKLKNKLFK